MRELYSPLHTTVERSELERRIVRLGVSMELMIPATEKEASQISQICEKSIGDKENR